MGQLLLVWLMHVSWVMATSVHDIYSPLMRRWPRKCTKLFKELFKIIQLILQGTPDKPFWQGNLSQNSTRICPYFAQIFPEFAHIWHSAPCLRFIRQIVLHYNFKPETIHSNLLSNITRHWVEAVDMIFFHSHHYNLHCTIENSAVVMLCSLRHVSSMFDPGLVLFPRKIYRHLLWF